VPAAGTLGISARRDLAAKNCDFVHSEREKSVFFHLLVETGTNRHIMAV
jgi:hypothetical protein